MRSRFDNDFKNFDNDFKDLQMSLFKNIPFWVKILWVTSVLFSISLVALLCWGVYEGICYLQSS